MPPFSPTAAACSEDDGKGRQRRHTEQFRRTPTVRTDPGAAGQGDFVRPCPVSVTCNKSKGRICDMTIMRRSSYLTEGLGEGSGRVSDLTGL